MSYRRDSRGDVVHVIPTNHPPENWFPTVGDASIWATEEDYAADNTQSSKTSRGDSPASSNRAKSIGKTFFKTKLCCTFRSGTCPYVSNCNFAHSVEELRRPPPNWQEVVATHEDDKSGVMTEPAREEFQIPSLVSSVIDESRRSFKGRHCKRFYTEDGCPYGDSCTFLHDDASRDRESVAISLGPSGYSSSGGNGGGVNGGSGGGQSVKPSNWKTRICNKWELTGYCPFGSKCHFAHGTSELHRFAGGLADGEAKDVSYAQTDTKQTGVGSKGQADSMAIFPSAVPHSDIYHAGVALQRPGSIMIQKAGTRANKKWKGPDKVSRIYGDWIDDFE